MTEAIRVLLLEDNPDDADMVQELVLRSRPSHVEWTHVFSLSDGLNQLQSKRFDAALVDLSLPDSQGLDTLIAVLAEAPALPIVVLTGHAQDATAQKAIEKGAQDYVTKWPKDGQSITRAVRYAIERKRLESQLRQAQKMEAIGHLAGGIAHDFNNLLTIITGYSELVINRLRAEDPSGELLREVCKAGTRAAALTRQLLAFSRKQILEPVVLDINSLVTELGKMLRRLIGEDIDLSTALDPALARVKADPGQMEQVIINLAVNARDAMPTGGKFTIETQNVELDESCSHRHEEMPPGPYVLLAVTDSGCGMDRATLARIFEPFFTTKEAGKGTGLGLAMVYGIVKQSGGFIYVYSEPGHGTTFKIYLPQAKTAIPAGLPASSVAPVPSGTETVLLAEDEEGVRSLARIGLQSSGYTVLEACNGEEALRIGQQHSGPIHLLVTDVVMPKMGGRQLAEHLTPLRPDIKVMYLSGYTDDAVVRHGVLEVDMPFLQKPFTPTSLARKVRQVLDQRTSTVERPWVYAAPRV